MLISLIIETIERLKLKRISHFALRNNIAVKQIVRFHPKRKKKCWRKQKQKAESKRKPTNQPEENEAKIISVFFMLKFCVAGFGWIIDYLIKLFTLLCSGWCCCCCSLLYCYHIWRKIYIIYHTSLIGLSWKENADFVSINCWIIHLDN